MMNHYESRQTKNFVSDAEKFSKKLDNLEKLILTNKKK